jgi:hypothetical protein
MGTFVKFKLVFALVFALAGTLFLTIAYREWRANYQIVAGGIETEGRVVDTYRKPRRTGERPSAAEAPVVEFAAQNGAAHRYHSTLFTAPCSHQVGESVRIWYLPENPQKATMNGQDAWVLPIVFGIFGSVISLLACSWLFRILYEQW